MPDDAQTNGAPCTTGIACCNGGLQVLNPSQSVYDLILAALQSPTTSTYGFADQSLMSDIFYGRWVPLPYVYNALKSLRWHGVHHQIWKDECVKCVHYILTPKPWQSKEVIREEDHVPHSWWFQYNDERLASEREIGIDDGF